MTEPTNTSKELNDVFFVDAAHGWAAGDSGLVLYRGSPTSVRNSSEGIVSSTFRLQQNYPNPFNPTTRIRFAVGSGGFVTLMVYNLIGQEAATVFSGYKTPGEYSVDFDAGNLPAGVYFYKLDLNNGSAVAVRKMALVK